MHFLIGIYFRFGSTISWSTANSALVVRNFDDGSIMRHSVPHFVVWVKTFTTENDDISVAIAETSFLGDVSLTVMAPTVRSPRETGTRFCGLVVYPDFTKLLQKSFLIRRSMLFMSKTSASPDAIPVLCAILMKTPKRDSLRFVSHENVWSSPLMYVVRSFF